MKRNNFGRSFLSGTVSRTYVTGPQVHRQRTHHEVLIFAVRMGWFEFRVLPGPVSRSDPRRLVRGKVEFRTVSVSEVLLRGDPCTTPPD